MKKQIRLIVLPLYRCNQNCKTCLFKENHEINNTLDLARLDSILSSLNRDFDITSILVSGGEISLLSDLYLDLLYQICKIYTKRIYAETNFIHPTKALLNNFDVINVKHNFTVTNPFKFQIFENIRAALSCNKIINVKSLDIHCQIGQNQIIEQLNNLKIKSFEIIPYHPIKNSQFSVNTYDFFEKTVQNFLKLSSKMKFAFQNKLQLEKILNLDNYNIKTVYITPNNKLALQNFDENNYFSLKEYENYTVFTNNFKEMEKKQDEFCKNCTSKLQCMANRFLNLNYNGPSCSGFKDLINKYK